MKKPVTRCLNETQECDRCKKELTQKHKKIWVKLEENKLLLCLNCYSLLLTFSKK